MTTLQSNPLFDLSNAPTHWFITRLAQGGCGTPLAFVLGLVNQQQIVLGCAGYDARIVCQGFPHLDDSCLGQIIATRSPLRVHNVQQDSSLRGDPLVRHTAIAAYLGVPIMSPAGNILGALIVADRVPRGWPDGLLHILDELATSLMNHMSTAVHDRETGLATRHMSTTDTDAALMALESVTDACFVVNQQWRIAYVNSAAERLVSVRRDALLGTDIRALMVRLGVEAIDTALTAASWSGGHATIEWHDREVLHWYEARAFPAVAGFVIYIRDITEDKLSVSRLIFEAHHDPLTSLPNRRLILDRLNIALAHSRRHALTVGVLLLDLDKFKEINDSLGHAAGDALLIETAIRLRATLREGDSVGRLAGDEFIIVLPSINTVRDAIDVANRILLAIAQPMQILGHEPSVSISIGVSLSRTPADQAGDIMARADSALYDAKRRGKHRYSVER